jgi:hypothetical protein
MSEPINLLLYCPNCATQHVDEARPDVCETCGGNQSNCTCAAFTAWLNPPHRSHRCGECNHVWRPSDVPTNGVAQLQTRGERDGSPRPRHIEAAMHSADHLYVGGLEAALDRTRAELETERARSNR